MQQIPRRAVTDRYISAQLFCGNATLVMGHQEYGAKPFPQAEMAFMHNSPGRQRNLMPAFPTLIETSRLYKTMLCATASGTHKTFRPLDLEKMIAAILFRLEFIHELHERQLFLLQTSSPISS
jgi:hypothetical protein